jgi:hypothetical protein
MADPNGKKFMVLSSADIATNTTPFLYFQKCSSWPSLSATSLLDLPLFPRKKNYIFLKNLTLHPFLRDLICKTLIPKKSELSKTVLFLYALFNLDARTVLKPSLDEPVWQPVPARPGPPTLHVDGSCLSKLSPCSQIGSSISSFIIVHHPGFHKNTHKKTNSLLM